jgi:hypothetical protein
LLWVRNNFVAGLLFFFLFLFFFFFSFSSSSPFYPTQLVDGRNRRLGCRVVEADDRVQRVDRRRVQERGDLGAAVLGHANQLALRNANRRRDCPHNCVPKGQLHFDSTNITLATRG